MALTEESAPYELARILSDIAETVADEYASNGTNRVIRDANGNDVGYWQYVPESSAD